MKETGVHFAVAIDEYGGMSGIATMHDLVELLIGELFEEGETPRPCGNHRAVGRKLSWKIQGFADIEDVAEELDIASGRWRNTILSEDIFWEKWETYRRTGQRFELETEQAG